MDTILQGTTPTVTITIYSDEDQTTLLDLSDVVKVQFIATQFGWQNALVSTTEDAVIDTSASTISYTFTEEQTMQLDAHRALLCQCRLMLDDETIMGVAYVKYDVALLLDHSIYLGA